MRLSKDIRKPHGEAFKMIGRYMKGSGKLGIYILSCNSGYKVWSDDDFSVNWLPEEAMDESDT